MDLVATDSRRLVLDNGRYRSYTGEGIQSIKAGQTITTSLLDSIVSAYTSLVYNIPAMILLSLGTFILIAEYNQSTGPIELIAEAFKQCHTIQSAENGNKLAAGICGFGHLIFNRAAAFKYAVGVISLCVFPYITKPSKRHLILTAVLLIITLIMHLDFLELFVLSQLYFLFATLRNPVYKTLCVILFFAIFIIGSVTLPKPVQYTPTSIPSHSATPVTRSSTTTKKP